MSFPDNLLRFITDLHIHGFVLNDPILHCTEGFSVALL